MPAVIDSLKSHSQFASHVEGNLKCISGTVEHLLTATSPQWPLFMVDSPCIDCSLKLSTMATCLQRPLSSVPKMAVVWRGSTVIH